MISFKPQCDIPSANGRKRPGAGGRFPDKFLRWERRRRCSGARKREVEDISDQAPSKAYLQPGRVYIELAELSSKQRKSMLGLMKDMGFAPGELSELVVVLPAVEPGEDTTQNEVP